LLYSIFYSLTYLKNANTIVAMTKITAATTPPMRALVVVDLRNPFGCFCLSESIQ